MDYRRAAEKRNSVFVSVILHCALDENLRRISGEDRGAGANNTKLTDPNIVRSIREEEDIFHFHGPNEIEIDVTCRSPTEVAKMIVGHINSITEQPLQSLDSQESLVSSLPQRFADIKGFKHVFVSDLQKGAPGQEISLQCWLFSRPRHHGGVLFLPIGDSSGSIQAVALQSEMAGWSELKSIKPETSLQLSGILSPGRNGSLEIALRQASIISKATGMINPDIRKAGLDILEATNTDHVLSHRHLYLRNPLIHGLNLYRSHCFSAVHEWLKAHQFVDFSAPLVTPSILYEPSSAIHISNLKARKPLFLSQCAGFYLEAAAHAHDRVYNLGPSFRNESRTNRHLMEYWHIKAELCSGGLDDIICLVEIFLRDIFEAVHGHTETVTALLGTKSPVIRVPFARITYREAIKLLVSLGLEISFSQNISSKAERLLTEHFHGPVWVTHKPRALEPFPYCINPVDDELTMTADLISPDGFGEICGVAEKSFTREDQVAQADKLYITSKNVTQSQVCQDCGIRGLACWPKPSWAGDDANVIMCYWCKRKFEQAPPTDKERRRYMKEKFHGLIKIHSQAGMTYPSTNTIAAEEMAPLDATEDDALPADGALVDLADADLQPAGDTLPNSSASRDDSEDSEDKASNHGNVLSDGEDSGDGDVSEYDNDASDNHERVVMAFMSKNKKQGGARTTGTKET
ncbi:uncharacterized protein PG986_004123 [Apiospora aurea]|uniref:Aminoacyl-transfer RNA synthetases class-II family profile domain-containing protein n=1 Tax=Apiospora aurea TaxID=335848 RepID=A0ABR1QLP5_9PEZI